MNRPLDTKRYLLKTFIVLFAIAFAFMAVCGALISVVQIRSMHGLYAERLGNIIRLHSNELLNEIALNDTEALSQHLRILQNELLIDSVKLDFHDRALVAFRRGGAESGTWIAIRPALLKAIGIRPIEFPIANDFKSIDAKLTVTYDTAFSDWVLIPLSQSVSSILAISLLPVALVFIVLFRKIDRRLIRPLREATLSLESAGGNGKILDYGPESLEEIRSLVRASGRFQEAERLALLSRMAREIAHDIRSPIAALNMVVASAKELPEDVRILLRSAVGRIGDIANALIERSKQHKDATCLERPISALVEEIVSEKRVQYRGLPDVRIEAEIDRSYGLFVGASPAELKRALSNLIDNAVEAQADARRAGVVTVEIRDRDAKVEVVIRDEGIGMPATILARLGEASVSFGKERSATGSGSGLGVHFAKKVADAAGGSLRFASEPGQGTTAVLSLPKTPSPSWFVPALRLGKLKNLAVIDDDTSVHEIWKRRIPSGGRFPRLLHFRSPEELLAWFDEKNTEQADTHFLCDYDFANSKLNGFDLIERLAIQKRATLVTSCWDDEATLSRAVAGGIGLVPKNLAHLVPFDGSSPK